MGAAIGTSTDQHSAQDPEPVPGSMLQTGSAQDRVMVLRLESGQWTWWHNGDRAQPCSYELVKFWCPMSWLSRPRGPIGARS